MNGSQPALADLPAPRVDLYAMVHKAVRRSLFDTMKEVGASDLGEADTARLAAARVHELLEKLDGHARVENTLIHPRLDAVAPYVAQQLARDHESLDREQAEIAALATRLAAAPHSPRAVIGAELYRRLGLLVASQLQHMAREEEQANRALWACLSDEALLEINGRILASFSPEQLLANVTWMAPALAPDERLRLLGGVARKVSAQVLARILQNLREVLPPSDFGHLALALPRAE